MDYSLLVTEELMVERLAEFLRRNPPTLDDILGAACELYRVDPGEIDQRQSGAARRMVCYIAARWARVPNAEIGKRVGCDALAVSKAFGGIARALDNPLLRDDLDLLGVRIAERILVRRRNGRLSS